MSTLYCFQLGLCQLHFPELSLFSCCLFCCRYGRVDISPLQLNNSAYQEFLLECGPHLLAPEQTLFDYSLTKADITTLTKCNRKKISILSLTPVFMTKVRRALSVTRHQNRNEKVPKSLFPKFLQQKISIVVTWISIEPITVGGIIVFLYHFVIVMLLLPKDTLSQSRDCGKYCWDCLLILTIVPPDNKKDGQNYHWFILTSINPDLMRELIREMSPVRSKTVQILVLGCHKLKLLSTKVSELIIHKSIWFWQKTFLLCLQNLNNEAWAFSR